MRARIAAGTAILLLISSIASTVGTSPEAYQPLPQSAFTEVQVDAVPHEAVRRPDVLPTREGRSTERRPTHRVLLHPRLQPRPRPTHYLGGLATWYCLPGVSGCQKAHKSGPYAAAGPSLRLALGSGWRGRLVTVSVPGKKSVTVRLTDWCACPAGHTIDLYADVFDQLGDLSRGVLKVTVFW